MNKNQIFLLQPNKWEIQFLCQSDDSDALHNVCSGLFGVTTELFYLHQYIDTSLLLLIKLQTEWGILIPPVLNTYSSLDEKILYARRFILTIFIRRLRESVITKNKGRGIQIQKRIR